MKKSKSKAGRILRKLLGIGVIANLGLFAVFYFDLDGRFLYHVVEPLLCRHYDNMKKKDMLSSPYDMDKYPSYEYEV